ncbi:hypothetical protein [Planococcus sp. S3-L1]|uniref:hypothetical protein n=1 Tax=Planococcus sp. S3-L1 TaxID=3046200 RepID=UPI0024B9FE4D|nr:hypothetical protein [Planococcus sp. S3-L1]MDJ0332121.1 hypothetical protein [Planococcus sp. S3-L1]
MGVRKEEQRKWQAMAPQTRHRFIETKEGATVYDAKGNDITDKVEVLPTYQNTPERVRALQGIDELSTHQSDNGGFVFAFFKEARTIVERFPTLTQADTARLLFIGTFVAWATGRLQYDNGRPISRKQLQELSGMSRPRFSEFYKRLEGEGILSEDAATKDVYMNPTVIYRGEMKQVSKDVADLEYTRVFRSTVRRLYEEFDGKQLKQLGLIYSVLPFISAQTNIVVTNPEEKDSERLQPMNVRTLAMILEYSDPQKLKTALNAVKIDGNPVFLFADDPYNRREKRIVVNPRVVFKGNNEALKAISVLFN